MELTSNLTSGARALNHCAIFFFFLEREGREVERGRELSRWERNTPTQDRTHNPGMCQDWESNWRPFAVQDNAQPTEPQGSALSSCVHYCLSEHTLRWGMELEVNSRRKAGIFTNMWNRNNTLLSNQCVNEEFTREIRRYLENKWKQRQNLWDARKQDREGSSPRSVLTRKKTVLQAKVTHAHHLKIRALHNFIP